MQSGRNAEIDEFIEYVKEERRKKDYRFRINMTELQTERLTEHVRLDPSNDPPLPDWARKILDCSHLSKRTRIYLMKFHNRKIIEKRLAIANPSIVSDSCQN